VKRNVAVLSIGLLLIALLSACSSEMTGEQIYSKLSLSTVEILGEGNGFSSTGSGFFIDDSGTVITNYHVIDGCTSAAILTYAGDTYEVESLLGFDEDLDIAILSTSCKNSTSIEIAEKAVTTGETVYALGSSQELTGTFSEGIVSSAERKVNGSMYIQTTAPVSNGNSGGPLVNSKGQVVGIVSAGLEDGQNINFAIPIDEINSVETDSPISLEELFRSTVEWLSEWQIWYEPEYDSFVLVFELADENEVPMSSDGTIDIRIVNDDGITVYEGTTDFSHRDFDFWYYENDTVEKYQASILIGIQDIETSSCSQGTVYFTLEGEDYYFDETSLPVYDLPLLPISVDIPELPTKLSYCGYDGQIYTTVRIDDISYELMYGDSLYFYYTGEKVYESRGAYDDSCGFEWKLYDAEGYLIETGTVFISGLDTGDKFKNEEAYVFSGITAGQRYKLVLSNY